MDIETIVAETALGLSVLDSVEGTCLHEDYGLDSLNVTRLIVQVEEKLDIEIDMGLLMTINLQTIEDICEIVRKSMEN